MLDTMLLNIVDFKIKQGANLIIKPSNIDYKTGQKLNEYLLSNEPEIVGCGAFLNKEHYSFSLKPKGNDVFAFCQFSVPKYLTGSNFYSVGAGGLKTALKRLESDLKANGIETNIMRAKLSRIDKFDNLSVKHRFLDYSDLFSLLSLSRKRLKDYGTTFLFHNGAEEICIYDKNVEMKHRKEMVNNIPENVVRLENRLLNHRKIVSMLKIDYANELVENYFDIKQILKQNVVKQLFKYEPSDIDIISINTVKGRMSKIFETYSYGALSKYLQFEGIYSLISKMGKTSIERALKEAIYSLNISETNKRVKYLRAKRKLEELVLETKTLAKMDNLKLSVLYKELRTKFLKVA